MYSRVEANEEHDEQGYHPHPLTSRDPGSSFRTNDSSPGLQFVGTQTPNSSHGTPRKNLRTSTDELAPKSSVPFPDPLQLNGDDSTSDLDSSSGDEIDYLTSDDLEDGIPDTFNNSNLHSGPPNNQSSLSIASLQNQLAHPDSFILSRHGLRVDTSQQQQQQQPQFDHPSLPHAFSTSTLPDSGVERSLINTANKISLPPSVVNPSESAVMNTTLPSPNHPDEPGLQLTIPAATTVSDPPTIQPVSVAPPTAVPRQHNQSHRQVEGHAQEFLHHHLDRKSATQLILGSKATDTLRGTENPKTAIAIAVDEINDGIAKINAGLPKPIPTFTRAHFNTNWITDKYNTISSHYHRGSKARLATGGPNAGLPTVLSNDQLNDSLISTFSSPTQERQEFDDSFDVEKNQVSQQFINCLKLRREFLFTPAFVDRRPFNLLDRPGPYEPVLDATTVSRPAFEALSSTTTQTVSVVSAATAAPSHSPSPSPSRSQPRSIPSTPQSATSPNNPLGGDSTRSSFNAAHPGAHAIASPRFAGSGFHPRRPSCTGAEPGNVVPSIHHTPHPSQLVTTTVTTIDPEVYHHIDPYLSAELINTPQNFMYGFVNGVLQLFPSDARDIVDYQRQINRRKREQQLAADHSASDPNSSLHSDWLRINRRQQRDRIHDDRFYQTGTAHEREYRGYCHDVYHLALHQHHAAVGNESLTSVDPPIKPTPTQSIFSPFSPAESGSEMATLNSNAIAHTDSTSFLLPTEDAVECDPRQLDPRFTDSNPKYDNLIPVPSWNDFCDALIYILQMAGNGPCKSWAYQRLTMLDTQKSLHTQLNQDLERAQSKAVPHRDFYNVRKIDNHVHHSACMNQKHLLRFIKRKLREPEANTLKVITRDGTELTLAQVFKSLGLSAYDLSIDTLDMHASQTFHRFDKFNAKYSPIQETRLREIFLKYNNNIKGQYLAEITREVFEDLHTNKYQFAEYRVSIYGKELTEWDSLADWIIDNKLVSPNVRWMIQIPRLYRVYKGQGLIDCFQDMLTNIFLPIFHCTLFPHENPKLHQLLNLIVGFDTVDDESVRTRFFDKTNTPPPQKYTDKEDPHYGVFLYYLYANLRVVNHLRELVGLNTFALRPHAGEAGDEANVAAAFLTSRGINHGLTLHRTPPIQYLYYLAQVGISMSPLSNNLLFLEYQKNPFPKFFNRGLNVTLSTDDPLMIHVTKEPLIEEYSIASQVWGLSHLDLCEIAKNSVLQSGFEHPYKVHWLGNSYYKHAGTESNDIRASNLPDIRAQYRWEVLYREHLLLTTYAFHHNKVDVDLIDPQY